MNYNSINKRIIDRSDIFYWQAERKISEEEAATIWKDRHSSIKNEELIQMVNKELKNDTCISIDPTHPNNQESLGSVNSNRVGHLASGKDVIIRCHPKGIKNGYFYVESLVADLLIKNGLPSYKTYTIHECKNSNDCAFQVIEKINGIAIQKFLEKNPEMENKIMFAMGKTLAKINKIKVEGYGPFDNELAKKGQLKGIHSTFYDSVVAGLEFDLNVLVEYNVISSSQATSFRKLFSKDNPLLQDCQPVLVHNDFVDWNSLTDGQSVNGIIDLDECVASDPLSDLACWSLFFDSENRKKHFFDGYFSIAEKRENFEDKFQLLRLRYSLSKMTLRTRRYNYDQSEFLKARIEAGKANLKESAEYFKL